MREQFNDFLDAFWKDMQDSTKGFRTVYYMPSKSDFVKETNGFECDYEDDGSMKLTVGLPGVDPINVSVKSERYVVKVLVAKTDEGGETREVERARKNVGANYKVSEAQATLENGLLTIVIPPVESYGNFEIEVNKA